MHNGFAIALAWPETLCKQAGALVAVEQDLRLLPVLSETTGSCEDINVINDDAVTIDVASIKTRLGPPEALIANLPYGVAATVAGMRVPSKDPTLDQ